MLSLRRAFALLALALVVAPLVASAPLFDPDEGLHAAIAQEMNARGDYVTPTFLGEPFLDKPILFFWAEALSLRVIGHNEAAVRMPPLLFGLFGMIAVAALGRALFDETAGLAAGIAYGTMLLPLGVSEVAVHDIGLVGFMCVACWCMWRIAEPSASVASTSVASTSVASAFRRKSVLVVLAGVCLGLSILTKGLVGVVFTGIFAACLAVYRPAAIVRLAIALAIAGAIALLVAAPWYIAMERAHPGYLHYYFVERHLQGYLTATQRHAGRPFWYYVPILLGGALPWTPYLFVAATSARRHPLRVVVWSWFGIGLIFLSIGESKLVTYALPLFPALAIVAGEYVAIKPRRSALAVQIATLALLPAAGLLLMRWKYSGSVDPVLWILVGVMSVLTIVPGLRARASNDASESLVWIAAMSACALAGLMVVSPRAAEWMTSRDLAAVTEIGDLTDAAVRAGQQVGHGEGSAVV